MNTRVRHTVIHAVFACLLVAGLAGIGVPAVAQLESFQEAASRALPTPDGRQRLALVIGNAAYKEGPLLNPVNDARGMTLALRDAGFTVIHRENADQRVILAALREFGDRLRSGGTGVFYFAGHGMQIKGRNYLVPVNASFEREDEIAYKTIDAQAVLDKMETAGNMTNIMILDACRNNPFARSSRSAQQGLAQMDAPVGTLVAYATAPGSVASDGRGSNGLYTHHLLNAIRQPGSKVEDVFKQVRAAVRRESGGAQVPWESTSLEGDFYFKLAPGMTAGAQAAAASAAVAAVQAPQLPSAPKPADPLELALWELVRNSSAPLELSAYLNRYPNGLFADAARARLAQLASPGAQPSLPSAAVRPDAAANASGFVAGDRWRFQVVDKFRGEVVRNYVDTVDSILPDGGMVLNGGRTVWDARGNLRTVENSDLQARYSDYVLIPPALQPGARTALNYKVQRKTASGQFNDEGKGSMVVRGRERVVTPAGTFDAWKVEIEIFGYTKGAHAEFAFGSQPTGTGGWRRAVTGWYVPELRNYVAFEEEIRTSTGVQNSSTGTHTHRERHELTSYTVRGAENLAQR